MRDILLLAAMVGLVPLVLRAPQLGVLAWTWVTLFNPQREVFGFLSGFQINFYLALLTAFAWAISRERKTVPFNPVSGLLVIFAIWISVTTYNGLDTSYSYVIWDRTIKSIVLALAILTLANNKTRIQAMVWMVAVSLGYYAVKGGGYVLLTGGHGHVLGPADTMIYDNNALGLALVMLLPVLNYLRVTSRSVLVANINLTAMLLSLVAIVGTYSRGAMIALGASLAVHSVKSHSKLVPLLLGGLVLVSLPNLVPSGWFNRMATIQTYNADTSFGERLQAWTTSLNIAEARPIVGGGFSAVQLDWVADEFKSPGSLPIGRASHSIYFEVLSDHGFVGLALYLLLLAAAWYNTSLVVSWARGRPEYEWANRLARALQVSMAGYLVGGAALSMAYYDGFLILLALTGALVLTVRQENTGRERVPATARWKTLDQFGKTAIPVMQDAKA